MKLVYGTLSFLLLCCNMTIAQATFKVEPNPLQVNTTSKTDDAEAVSLVINLNSVPKSIKWERTIIALTSGCLSQICDPNLCYVPSISSDTFDLLPNDSSLFIPHLLNPDELQCCAIVHVKLINLAAANSDTVQAVYLFNDCNLLSAGEPLPEANVSVYPNPAGDFFFLRRDSEVARVRMFSADGRLVQVIPASPGTRYSVATQTSGTYFLVLDDRNDRPFQVIQWRKN